VGFLANLGWPELLVLLVALVLALLGVALAAAVLRLLVGAVRTRGRREGRGGG
jgi:Na+-transporting methylmalonyl-CoA/oxaloacetate decarboxylase gamma subunit